MVRNNFINTGTARAFTAGGGEATLADIIRMGKDSLLAMIWQADPKFHKILTGSVNLHEARNGLFKYLNSLERSYYNIYADNDLNDLHDLKKRHAKNCVRILKNLIRTENERLTGISALAPLWEAARSSIPAVSDKLSEAFLAELLFMLKGINGQFDFYRIQQPVRGPVLQTVENPGLTRSNFLDSYSRKISEYTSRYPTGLDSNAVGKSRLVKQRILDYLGASEQDWTDYRWQLKNIFTRRADIERVVELSAAEASGLDSAENHGLPVQITPYYLSLFHPWAGTGMDRAIRAQVLPTVSYVEGVMEALGSGEGLDFMGESSTTPIEGITRRYVQVLILKVFDSCPQVCVYCQRNWELKSLEETRVNREKVEKAIEWVRENENIEEVLLTGGDPLTLPDEYLESVIGRLAEIDHIARIRLSTRVPVTMPCRITDKFVEMVSRYHDFGRREICVVTHFEHPTEMTPDALGAIRKLRAAGLNVYNQEVFTYFNSRKFESFHLRRVLKRCGVDPYYTFNTKGKKETNDYRVPIARLLQEFTEEARLLPGTSRTDAPVFNVPTLGKSYLHAWQDHEIVMLKPDGTRVYKFYPWESMMALTQPYLYNDVSIYDYLKRLDSEGEDVEDYGSIWYYF